MHITISGEAVVANLTVIWYCNILPWYAPENLCNYYYRCRDILLDDYAEDELETVCRELRTPGDSSPERQFRTLLDILLGNYRLTRGG